MCYVYIASCLNVDFIKIGISTDPQRRLGELQNNSPYAITLVFLIECVDSSVAQQLEKLLHELMHASRSNGEWFHASADTAIQFAKALLVISGKFTLSDRQTTRNTRQNTPDKPIDKARAWLAEHPNHGMPYRLAAATAGVSESAMQRAMQKPIK